MCHSNLDIKKPVLNYSNSSTAKTRLDRLFTVSEGQLEIKFPEGFGVPIMSDQKFSLSNQVLNHNFPNPHTEVRHKIQITLIRDKDLKNSLKPLFLAGGYVMVTLEKDEKTFGEMPSSHAACLPGQNAPNAPKKTFLKIGGEDRSQVTWLFHLEGLNDERW